MEAGQPPRCAIGISGSTVDDHRRQRRGGLARDRRVVLPGQSLPAPKLVTLRGHRQRSARGRSAGSLCRCRPVCRVAGCFGPGRRLAVEAPGPVAATCSGTRRALQGRCDGRRCASVGAGYLARGTASCHRPAIGVDPPRTGCSRPVRGPSRCCAAARIVYVSYDPPALAARSASAV